MALSVRQGEDAGILFHLTLSDGAKDRMPERWSLLTPHQRRCVLRYLEYMYAVSLDSPYDAAAYLKAIEGYWSKAVESSDEPLAPEKSASRPKRKKRVEGW